MSAPSPHGTQQVAFRTTLFLWDRESRRIRNPLLFSSSDFEVRSDAIQNAARKSSRSEGRLADIACVGQSIDAVIDRTLSLRAVVDHVKLPVALIPSPILRNRMRESQFRCSNPFASVPRLAAGRQDLGHETKRVLESRRGRTATGHE